MKEDKVDEYWEKMDGKIHRPKGKNGCRCGPKSMCDYCMPLEVSRLSSHSIWNVKPDFDGEYSLSMQSIKHQILSNICRTIPTSRNFTLLSRLPLKLRPTSHLSRSLPTPSKSPVPPVLTLLGPPESVRNVNLQQSRSLAKRTE